MVRLFTLTCSSAKQYDLVVAKEWWCFAAGKLSAGLVDSNSSLLTSLRLILPCFWCLDIIMNSRLNARVYCVATFSPHRNDTARFCVCYNVVMFVTIAVEGVHDLKLHHPSSSVATSNQWCWSGVIPYHHCSHRGTNKIAREWSRLIALSIHMNVIRITISRNGGGICHVTATSQYHAHSKQVPVWVSNIV